MNCNGGLASGAYYVRNDSSGGKTAQIYYFLRGDQACSNIPGVVSNAKNQQDDTTRCGPTLPTLP